MENLAEKYIDQTASQQELGEIQQKLESDSSFKEEVVQLQAIKSILKAEDRANLYLELDGLFEQTVKPKSIQPTKSDKSFKRFILLMAACVSVMLVALISFQYLRQNPAELYADFYKPFKVSNLRSEVKEGVYWSGVELYQKGDFGNALPVFEKSIEEQPEKSNQTHLLIGVCYLQLNQVEKAILEFDNVNVNNEYKQEANWYSALANLKLEETEKAKSILEAIVSNNSLYSQKAKQLLEKM
jgi:tetratricopeptide (TPR) repeat protein